MDTLHIYHHLGLGDHLMCNGLVRELVKDEEHVVLFCKPHNKTSVQFMYRDLDNMYYMTGYDVDVINFLTKSVRSIKIGFQGDNFPSMPDHVPVSDETNIIQTFYRQGNIDPEKRWSSWYVSRDFKSEKKFFKDRGLNEGDPFIFIHDDVSRNYNINFDYIRHDVPIIQADRKYTNNIFDYCYLLENAIEIHCMDSTFRILCEHLETKGTLFFHQYCKGSDGWGVPISRKNWIKII